MLTPVDIENKEFGKAFRGYDIDEVEEFLQLLVNDYEKLYRENASLKEKNAMLTETIGNYRGMEETMQNAILAAQRSAEDIKRNAYQRAENIQREAQTRANEAIANADKSIAELESTYIALQGEVDNYRARMRSILETNLKLLDEMPRVEIKTIERVKVDPVVVDGVAHTAPIPKTEETYDKFADTIPVPKVTEMKEPEWVDIPGAETVVIPEIPEKPPVYKQEGADRVPLSEKIPVAQSTRASSVNPFVEEMMREKELAAKMPKEEPKEAVEEEEPVFSGMPDFSKEKEVVLNFEKREGGAQSAGTFYDVFSDDEL
ncbi:MAG: DivIVA domain-containing protein [Clostridia bacterium]|nr:DivIVA domain-containing protein [Clostridia bacterium]